MLALAAGCAGPPAPAPARPAPAPVARPTAEPAERPPDLSPLPEPKSLVLVVRADLGALGRLPLDGPVGAFVRAPLEQLAPELPPALGESLTSAPFEAALALDSPEALLAGGPDLVWSLPLGSFEAALALLRERERQDEVSLERVGSGVVSVTPSGERRSVACRLAVAVGPAPARLVCARRPQSLDALAPWLTRSLPVRPLGKEPLVVEAWPGRFAREHREKLAGLVRFIAPPSFGPRHWTDAAAPVLARDALDLLADTQRARLAVSEQSGGVVVELGLDLDGESSWAARTLASMPAKTPALGELFARLPPSTDAAWFFTGALPARTDEARQAFAGWLAAEVGPSVPRSTLDLVARTFIQRVPHLYAHGDAYGKDVGWGRQSGRALWERTRSTYGWHLIGFDEPAKAFVPELDRGMNAYNGGSLRDFAYRALPRLCRGLGKIRKKPAPRSLPAGSFVYELPLPGKFFDDCMRGRGSPPEPAPGDAIVVVVMPVDGRTFIGFGLGEQEMLGRMRAVAKPSGRFAFPALEAPDVRFGGLLSLAGVGGLLRFITMSEHYEWERQRLARMPSRGQTRAPFWISVDKSGVTRVVAKLELPGELVADVATR